MKLAICMVVMTALVDARIIGNVSLDSMLAEATQIVAGTIVRAENAATGSAWTVDVSRVYKGAPAERVVAHADRVLTAYDIKWLGGRRGIFLVNAGGSLLYRTGSVAVEDWFVPEPERLSTAADKAVAFCVDWMRGLRLPGGIIVRDLAVAAQHCTRSPHGEAVRDEFTKSPADRLLAVLIGVARSDPRALPELESWLAMDGTDWSPLMENIAWTLSSYRSPDPSGARILGRLALEAKLPRIRESAASALAAIHSDTTWPELAALLNAPDAEVRRLAMFGLERTVNTGALPGAPPVPAAMCVSGTRLPYDERPFLSAWRAYVRSVSGSVK